MLEADAGHFDFGDFLRRDVKKSATTSTTESTSTATKSTATAAEATATTAETLTTATATQTATATAAQTATTTKATTAAAELCQHRHTRESLGEFDGQWFVCLVLNENIRFGRVLGNKTNLNVAIVHRFEQSDGPDFFRDRRLFGSLLGQHK
jgi:hypothetical protein